MNSLKGCFPEPKLPPKRNFINENKRKVKQPETQPKPSLSVQRTSESDQPVGTLEKSVVKAIPSGRLTVSGICANKLSNSDLARPRQRPKSKARSDQATMKVPKTHTVSNVYTNSKFSNDKINGKKSNHGAQLQCDKLVKTFRDQCIQTVDVNDPIALLKDSIIKFPTVRPKQANISMQTREETLQPQSGKSVQGESEVTTNRNYNFFQNSTLEPSPEVLERMNISKSDDSESDKSDDALHVPLQNLHLETEDKEPDLVRILKTPAEFCYGDIAAKRDPLRAPPSNILGIIVKQGMERIKTEYQRGVLPAYLKRRKDEIEKNPPPPPPDFSCPEGHMVIPDEERVKTLSVLKNRFEELVAELNRMPIRTETLRMRKRKIELDKELSKIEEGIRVFSRLRVYVKVDGPIE